MDWNAPMSHAVAPGWRWGGPRWSERLQAPLAMGMAPWAGLPAPRAGVGVSPPFQASRPRLGSLPMMSCAAAEKPQLGAPAEKSMLYPRSVKFPGRSPMTQLSVVGLLLSERMVDPTDAAPVGPPPA